MTLRKLTTLVLSFVLILAISVSAQTLVQKEHRDNNTVNGTSDTQSGASLGSKSVTSSIFSLFDPSRFQMHQSYSIGFFSGNGGSQSIAMYLNSINYKLAQPLTLQLDIAYIHQPQTLFGAQGTSGLNGKVLPSFRLFWDPSKNFHMTVSYETRNAFYDPYYSPFYRGYYDRSLFGR
jgi:hypothetical protein